MAGAAGTKARGQLGSIFVSELHRRQLVSLARCGRLLAQQKRVLGTHTDPDAPLHLTPAGQSIPLSSWRRRRAQLLATNKRASAVTPTLPLC
jgi:hypothetical protein